MSKYIDANKLKTEIERQRDNALERQKSLEKIGQKTVLNEMIAFELNKILSFIDSLQQEQPEVDLEKEIQDWCKENVTGVNPIYTAKSLICGLLPTTALHFYELGLKARKEEQL